MCVCLCSYAFEPSEKTIVVTNVTHLAYNGEYEVERIFMTTPTVKVHCINVPSLHCSIVACEAIYIPFPGLSSFIFIYKCVLYNSYLHQYRLWRVNTYVSANVL